MKTIHDKGSNPKRKTLFRLLAYIKPHWSKFALGFFAMLFVTAGSLALPTIFGDVLVDRIFMKKDMGLLNLVAVGVVVLVLVRGLFTFTQSYCMSFVGYRVVADLRHKVYHNLQKQSIGYHESHRTGETIARITNDTGVVQMSVSGALVETISNILLLAGTLVMLFITNWRLSLLTLTVFPLAAFLISKVGTRIRGLSHRVQEKIADLTAVLQESIFGIKVVKAFTMEKYQSKRFSDENEASFKASMKSVKVIALLTPTIDLLFVIAAACVIWYGGIEVIAGRLTAGQFLKFFGYVLLATTPLTNLTNQLNLFQSSLAAADRIFEIQDLEEEIKDAPGAIKLPKLRGEVEFRDVTFGYRDGAPVLSNLNLKVKPGEIVALVGPSGAGKTSLVNLIPRFYDPTTGELLVDGYDLRTVQTDLLRRQIGLVPQESILFGVSIKENILYGRFEATDQEVEEAAKAANAHDFIMTLPDGYNTVIGERGASLSGGQRQRISIARAILRDPRILILDEATSALDTESERLVQDALEHLMKGRTTFIIAHRLSTVQIAHKIVVLAEGNIVEQGTHEELIALGGLYKRLYDTGNEFKMALG